MQGAQQRHEQVFSPRKVTDDGEVLGDSCLEVIGMHRKVHLPGGLGKVESLEKDAGFGSACSGFWEPACTSNWVSSQKDEMGQLLGIANWMGFFFCQRAVSIGVS